MKPNLTLAERQKERLERQIAEKLKIKKRRAKDHSNRVQLNKARAMIKRLRERIEGATKDIEREQSLRSSDQNEVIRLRRILDDYRLLHIPIPPLSPPPIQENTTDNASRIPT
jgi:hypothetical protein